MRPQAPSISLLLALLALAAAPASGGGAAQSKAQQQCINGFGAAAAGVHRARALENQRCLDAFGKGTLAKLGAVTLRSCLTRDAKGKVAKQVAKLAKVEQKSCSDAGDVPAFGLGTGGGAQVSYVTAQESTGLFLDVLSENLFATARTCDDDAVGCKCQAAIVDGAADFASLMLAEFAGCARQVLKAGAPDAGALGACVDDPSQVGSLAADSKGRFAKQRTKLAKTFTKRCGTAAPATLPGACVGLLGEPLPACVEEISGCRACLALNAAHGLSVDCDAFDDAAANGSCPGSAVAQQTFAIPSAAAPAETPGTPGVVVTNPQLTNQFGAAVDLNRAIYTRYAFRNPPKVEPDAILVLVPGFEGGAGGFQLLAENLIPRAFVESGDVFEVWGFDRRTHQLEDLEGLDLAETQRDPQLALNWLFGSQLGLDLGVLARRAEFYDAQGDVPFIANWTSLVHTRDIDAVVEAARAAARDGNVFLGGHSAGTGFTARYAATNLELDLEEPPSPGFEKLLGLVLLEGGGGSTAGAAPTDATLDLIEAKFDGGLFGAVRDDAPRCMDGTTPCTVATEAVDCDELEFPRCVEPVSAYAQFIGLSPQLLASAESIALQATLDPDAGQAILQVEQGAPGNTAIAQVPELAVLGAALPAATAQGLIGRFVDDDGFLAMIASFVAMSVGAEGPVAQGLATWLDIEESAQFPPCPGDDCVTPDNGPQPTEATAGVWGVEREPIRFERLVYTFFKGGTNFTDWYYPSAGLSTTQGLPGLDSSALSLAEPVGRGRSDIENLTEAAGIDIPVIGFGGTNGLVTVPADFVAFAGSIAPCAAPTCDGATSRVVDVALPSPAFPTFGGVEGGFEVYITEGYSHVDPLAAEDEAANQVVGPLADFLSRNTP